MFPNGQKCALRHIIIFRIWLILQVSTNIPWHLWTMHLYVYQRTELWFVLDKNLRETMVWDINHALGFVKYSRPQKSYQEPSSLCTFLFTNVQRCGLLQTNICVGEWSGISLAHILYIKCKSQQPVKKPLHLSVSQRTKVFLCQKKITRGQGVVDWSRGLCIYFKSQQPSQQDSSPLSFLNNISIICDRRKITQEQFLIKQPWIMST